MSGEVCSRLRDGGVVWQLCCPGCGQWADVDDDDQLHGRVSIDHTDTGCSFHQTRDLFPQAVAFMADAYLNGRASLGGVVDNATREAWLSQGRCGDCGRYVHKSEGCPNDPRKQLAAVSARADKAEADLDALRARIEELLDDADLTAVYPNRPPGVVLAYKLRKALDESGASE